MNPISLRFSTRELLGLILNVNNFDGYGSEVWEILAGCGWLWLVVGGCGWLWLVVGRCGWFWLVPRFSMYGFSDGLKIIAPCLQRTLGDEPFLSLRTIHVWLSAPSLSKRKGYRFKD